MAEQQKLAHFARLRALPFAQSIIIGLLMTERMLINAQYYYTSHRLLQPLDTIHSILDKCWKKALKPKYSINVESTQAKLEMLLTTISDQSLAADASRDALVALGVCVDSFVENDMQPAVQVAKISQGDIERFLNVTMEQVFSPQAFKANELVQYELALLDSLLEFFEQYVPTQADIIDMRHTVLASGVSNLGICLVEHTQTD